MSEEVQGFSFRSRSYAQAQEEGLQLVWPTPMRELLANPDGGDYVWSRLHYVFELPDPRELKVAAVALTDAEREVLTRFTEHARQLAGATLLGAQDTARFHFGGGMRDIRVETALSAHDVTVGFMVLLRQCFANDEEASFSKVRQILERRFHEARDEDAQATLKKWRDAHAAMRNKSLDELAQERMVAEGMLPEVLPMPGGAPASPIVRAPASPQEMLHTFWYGEHVHWGKRRGEYGTAMADDWSAANWQIAARKAAVDFTHFYLGFALLIERALRAAVEAGDASSPSAAAPSPEAPPA